MSVQTTRMPPHHFTHAPGSQAGPSGCGTIFDTKPRTRPGLGIDPRYMAQEPSHSVRRHAQSVGNGASAHQTVTGTRRPPSSIPVSKPSRAPPSCMRNISPSGRPKSRETVMSRSSSMPTQKTEDSSDSSDSDQSYEQHKASALNNFSTFLDDLHDGNDTTPSLALTNGSIGTIDAKYRIQSEDETTEMKLRASRKEIESLNEEIRRLRRMFTEATCKQSELSIRLKKESMDAAALRSYSEILEEQIEAAFDTWANTTLWGKQYLWPTK